MAQDTHYDVIIIGTGAGGGTLAYHLAPSGKRILLLERGGYLRRERDNWDSLAVFVQAKYRAQETWYDKDGNPFHPGIQYYVGGNTKVYGAALFRLRPRDFGEIQHYGGVSPAWPLSYDDFEPYYSRAEQLFHVHGHHGEDPTEGPWSQQYPYPAVIHEPRIQQLSDDLERMGLHPFHAPCGVLLDQDEHGQATHTSPCIRCNRYDGFPCLLHAKADAEVLCVAPALQHPNVRLLLNARATRLETNASGSTVTTVHVERDGQAEQYSGDIVVVACGAINSAALLLRSANDKHPTGLANRSDVVGRFYMRHISSAVMALSVEPNPTQFQKTLALNDFYAGADDSEYPLGNIQMVGKSDGEMLKGEAPFWAGWAPVMAFEDMARHSVDFWLTSEDLPLPDNRVTLNAQGEIVLAQHDVNMEAHRRLTAKLEDIVSHAGMHEHLFPRNLYLGKIMDISATAHQNGTVRFGRDPQTSALDLNCKAHDLDNLYVVDASFFPSCGAVNPALTIIANALRVGDHLLERLR
ncbi:MAG TPA: GMC family oxidoreductase [Chloroflexota bacterium]|nr:GMC family oxidoreductase [Chloroflexota bacterium]